MLRRRDIRRPMAAAAPIVLATAVLVAGPMPAVATLAPADPCGIAARERERSDGIPPGLVHAVALAESGRWLEGQHTTRAWPWTITAGADSFYPGSKAAAIAKVRELQAAGRTNIDVGCMQVNLGYHPDAFASLSEAFEPATNVAYGASYLKQLRQETRSWARATARYHSRDPRRGTAYREKVYRLWAQLRRGIPADTPRPAADEKPMLLGPFAGAERPGRRLILPLLPGAAPVAASAQDRPGAIAILRGH